MEKIKNLILAIKNHAGALSGIGVDHLAGNMTDTAAAINAVLEHKIKLCYRKLRGGI
jgi:hypothetical protein